ncbi:uncharacterized protein G2W53_004334 [Senna tora]|uniref:Uncharacterized protein n=1 Tax=Senna tora TaxID=362788 RepID=A0A835CGF2_9FABA|nr:uncharacterized protein G2W53_004334 [Senna tora]
MKYGGEHGGHHVGGVLAAGSGRSGGATRDNADDGEDVVENQEEAAERGEEELAMPENREIVELEFPL